MTIKGDELLFGGDGVFWIENHPGKKTGQILNFNRRPYSAVYGVVFLQQYQLNELLYFLIYVEKGKFVIRASRIFCNLLP
jgi:hypothetical protein